MKNWEWRVWCKSIFVLFHAIPRDQEAPANCSIIVNYKNDRKAPQAFLFFRNRNFIFHKNSTTGPDAVISTTAVAPFCSLQSSVYSGVSMQIQTRLPSTCLHVQYVSIKKDNEETEQKQLSSYSRGVFTIYVPA